MPAQRTSHAAKIRQLSTAKAKLERQLASVDARIEAAEASAAARLEREIARVERQCGVSAKKTAAKKTSKRSAKRAPTVEVVLPANVKSGKKRPKKAAKKAAKKASKKKSGKKAGKVAKLRSARSAPRSFQVDLFEDPSDRRPSWSGDLRELVADNDLDDAEVRQLYKLRPGASLVIDLGAGGLRRIKRRK